ncbi:WG repeat-containing protein [Winogradskyella ouciana]|uniref:WG repeat-containing protein n=1 Tax=Winogradskyella ouciana TaxID=2608631 RepID=UPI003D279EF8
MMKKLTFGIFITFLVSTCSSKKDSYLIKFYEGKFDEIGVPCGYLNSKGDTIVPIGKYYHCYTDTIRDFGMVMEKKTGTIFGIDHKGTELYEVFKYDNGPDFMENGLFRIIKNGKIGYANSKGKIIIEPRFECAYSFKDGFAKVSDNCETIKDGVHSIWKSENWYQITRNGKRAEK